MLAAAAALLLAAGQVPEVEVVVPPPAPADAAVPRVVPVPQATGADAELLSLVRRASSWDLQRLVATDPRLAKADLHVRQELLASVAEPTEALAVVANLFLGFGIGSMADGDARGGFLLLGDVASLVVMGHGLGRAWDEAWTEERSSGAISPDAELSLGLVMFLASRAAGVWLPTTYHGRRYEALEDAFRAVDRGWTPPLDENPGLAPRWSVGVPTDRGLAPGATIALRF